AELLTPLGVQPSEIRLHGDLLGTQVYADTTGATAAAGVWVAGNVANIQAQVVSSAAAGLAAAASINNDLITADASLALEAYRGQRVTTRDSWDQRYASMEQVWSGQPNDALVSETTALQPGKALDVGCGEGAVWLAEHGWDVALFVRQDGRSPPAVPFAPGSFRIRPSGSHPATCSRNSRSRRSGRTRPPSRHRGRG